MDWLRSEDLKEEKGITNSEFIITARRHFIRFSRDNGHSCSEAGQHPCYGRIPGNLKDR